jgi:hypothetical protein
MQRGFIVVAIVFVALDVATATQPELVIRASDIGTVYNNGFGLVVVTFKGEKAKEYAHWPRIEQEIRLLIPHEGLRNAQFSSDGIYFGFSDAHLAARFDKAIHAGGCCR